jgi:spore maturation protein CgeB
MMSRRDLRIAYVGVNSGTSQQRARALSRLGADVIHIDPWAWLAKNRLLWRLHLQIGHAFVGPLLDERLFEEVRQARPDVVWVNHGEFLGRRALSLLRSLGVPIVNYLVDNPFSSECRRPFARYRQSVDLYDLVVVVFEHVVSLMEAAGARRVIRRYISADEVAHLRYGETQHKLLHDVSFVGTWHPDGRGDIIASLIDRGIPLALWGDRWDRDRRWSAIKKAWRGPGIFNEGDYARVLGESRITLGLVNHVAGNQHTHRSTEIPAIGSLLCAERTPEHLGMYEDGIEAVFWNSPDECARHCVELLQDEPRRAEIAARGRIRAIRNQYFNEPILAGILGELGMIP